MRMYRSAFLVLVATLSLAMTHAATGTFEKDGDTYTVWTGTDKGSCHSRVITQGGETGVQVRCYDPIGEHEAVGDTFSGCTETQHHGVCAQASPPLTGYAGGQLNCPNGDAYNIGTGSETGGCTADGSAGHCIESGSPAHVAEANCSTGCGTVVGTGCCCKQGTSGCQYGKNCGDD